MHKKCFKFCFLTLALFFSIYLPSTARAATSSSVLVSVVPPSPAPYENVTITLSSYANDLSSVGISWRLNGVESLSGVGKNQFSFQAPAAGKEADIAITILFPEGTLEKNIVIKPATMVLLWQADDSYVPPFYKGKALPSAGSDIKVVAIPELRNSTGQLISPENLTYDWKQDYNNDANASGYGKNSYIFTNDYLENSNNIMATATTVDGSSSASENINIGAVEPVITFYRTDPDLGTLWEKSIDDQSKVTGSTEIIFAAPYFIAPKNILHPSLVFSWYINDELITNVGFWKNILPVKVPEGSSGNSNIRLDIENSNKIYQSSSSTINIKF